MGNTSSNPKSCTRCSTTFVPSSNRQLYCLDCQRLVNMERCKERWHRTYVKKGYNQSGKANNNWKGGVLTYRKHKKDKCEVCGSVSNLCVHHIDSNHSNNKASNLKTLCKGCHQRHHVKKCPKTGRFVSAHI